MNTLIDLGSRQWVLYRKWPHKRQINWIQIIVNQNSSKEMVLSFDANKAHCTKKSQSLITTWLPERGIIFSSDASMTSPPSRESIRVLKFEKKSKRKMSTAKPYFNRKIHCFLQFPYPKIAFALVAFHFGFQIVPSNRIEESFPFDQAEFASRDVHTGHLGPFIFESIIALNRTTFGRLAVEFAASNINETIQLCHGIAASRPFHRLQTLPLLRFCVEAEGVGNREKVSFELQREFIEKDANYRSHLLMS